MKLVAKIDAAADYARRGRAYRGRTDADLTSAWIAAFRVWADEVPANTTQSELDDLEAELRLRQMDLPHDAVQQDMERCLRRAARFLDEQSKNGVTSAGSWVCLGKRTGYYVGQKGWRDALRVRLSCEIPVAGGGPAAVRGARNWRPPPPAVSPLTRASQRSPGHLLAAQQVIC